MNTVRSYWLYKERTSPTPPPRTTILCWRSSRRAWRGFVNTVREEEVYRERTFFLNIETFISTEEVTDLVLKTKFPMQAMLHCCTSVVP